MSINVRGTIAIDRKTSRRGDFNVGDLSTEIGVFEVKDSLIEEFEPGKYTGEFVIRWIEPDSFSWRGRVFVKNRAQLDAIVIDEAAEGAAPPAQPPEPDPIEERRTVTSASVTTPAPTSAAAAAEPTIGTIPAPVPESGADRPAAPIEVPTTQAAVHDDPDQALFGNELFTLLTAREPLRLDPTVDRQQFRAQRDRLKVLGYGFDARSQAWSLRDDAPASALVEA